MQFSPTIIIRRVVVLSKGRVVFDEKFHAGLNIIRGENSSGKSTLLDFLFFALGGEVTQWREAATHCDQVTIEIAINDKIVTLARDVDSAAMRPMRIFPGEMDGNTTGAPPSWSIYPFRGTSSKESFSQILFRWLQLPEVTGEASGRITMNQILRLVYSDQITPIDRLFKEETFDTALIRQTVGDLLCGAYDDDLYQASLRLKEISKAHEEAASELRSLFTALGDVRHSLTLDWLQAERSKLNVLLSDLQDEVAKSEAEALRLETKHKLTLDEQNAAHRELRLHQKKIATIQQKVDNLQFEIADSRAYISSLQSKIVALRDARLTSQSLKGLAFSVCPACYAPLDNIDNADHCHLCSRPVDSERIGSRILLLLNDATLQLRQSQLLQSERMSELEQAQSELVDARAEWRSSVEK
jgi:DNA repair exonuclease SbcCD ATPase subunit